MQFERVIAERSPRPFPIYDDPIADLLRAHGAEPAERDGTVAHILAVCAGYAYSDTATMAMMASRLGMEGTACLRIAQTVDAMMIFSTAYILQSRCGRVVILCYRGTEPANVGNWAGDVDVGPDSMTIGATEVAVHSGFYRNVRATRWPVLEALRAALRAESVLDSGAKVDHPMEAFYITGHSLGGSMGVLFALGLAARAEHRSLADKLRAVYTFGQPLTAAGPLPEEARQIGRKLFRHINGHDIIPCLPPAVSGRLEHFGHQYRFTDGEWKRDDRIAAQLKNLREIPRSLLAVFAPARRGHAATYTMAEHSPHHYIAALRPKGRITEFADES